IVKMRPNVLPAIRLSFLAEGAEALSLHATASGTPLSKQAGNPNLDVYRSGGPVAVSQLIVSAQIQSRDAGQGSWSETPPPYGLPRLRFVPRPDERVWSFDHIQLDVQFF